MVDMTKNALPYFLQNFELGPSIKDVRSQREFVQCRHFVDKGVLQMQMSALFGTKNCRFIEIYGVSAQTRGGVNFSQFCMDILYGRSLTELHALWKRLGISCKRFVN